MTVITLISDWGLNDYYTAAVKGMIFKQLPDANIIDITHHLIFFNLYQHTIYIIAMFKNLDHSLF